VYRITAAVPISLSLVAQVCLLENLHRLDTMIVEKVAKKGRHTITRLGARFVERRTSRAVGALATPWSAGMGATPCSRVALVRVASKLAGTSEALRVAMRTDFRTSSMDRSVRGVAGQKHGYQLDQTRMGHPGSISSRKEGVQGRRGFH
jgi:hypothetical protein